MLKKCLIEVELYIEKDGSIDVDKNVDLLNDISHYWENKQLIYVGDDVHK